MPSFFSCAQRSLPVRSMFAAVAMLLAVAPTFATAENWPGWRGPRGDGSSLEKNLPVEWDAQTNIAWKVSISTPSHSSPIVWNDRVYLVDTLAETETRRLIALDRRTGQTVWSVDVLVSELEGKHRLNSWASSTPVTDGERIYVSFLDVDRMFVAAYDLQGKHLWTARPGDFSSKHGYCSSPVLFEDLVIINGDHDGDAYLVALDRKSGEVRWKTDRENKTRSYCTPLIRQIDGQWQMMLSGSKCVASYDPRTGARLWIIDGPTEQFVASLVMNEGLVFVTGGFPDHHILTVDPTGRGNVTDSHIVWRHRKSGLVSYVPSPIAVGDYFFCISDQGIGGCYDAKTGKILWQERMGRRFSASLVAADGLIYCLDDDGTTKVIKAGPKYEVVAENKLGEFAYASLAISHGHLFLRTDNHLYCIGPSETKLSQR